MTPNQVVSHNLRKARERLAWTQEKATEELAPYVGEKWSADSYAQAERAASGRRVRRFDADEIHAFSRTFGVPASYFFIPPDPDARIHHARPKSRKDEPAPEFDEGEPAPEFFARMAHVDAQVVGTLADTFRHHPDAWGALPPDLRKQMAEQGLRELGRLVAQNKVELERLEAQLESVRGVAEGREDEAS